jgi:pilus assembly protein FimV
LDKAIAPVGQVIVKSGDTASKIAAATKPTNVSLDQMLVALLRTNPTAFAGDNVNRIKAGSIVTIPSAEQVGATPAVEATQIVIAQSKDFNDFRRQLAGNAPTAAVVATDRKVSGSLQTTVEDKKASTTAVDKLTLSKGALQRQAAENQTASERNAKEASSRAAEISKNISDLSKLGAASSAVVPGPAVPVVAPASATPGLVALASPSAAPAASSSAVASTVPAKPASVAASTPVGPASALAKRPVPVPMPRTEASLVDGLIENPLVPLGAMGLIALLAFFGFYRSKQRKNASRVDSIFLESRLRPDSFFGASGGQSVDTNDNAPPGSSMVYSTSQLDAVDNVDPVAEADVYLAYGRDLQAEEILKDALRTNPGRIAIHQKLLDIFAKRLDTSSFETIATLAYKVTSGDGPDWARICELGLSIDPSNDLYLPGGQPKNPDGTPSRPAPLDFISNLAASAAAQAVQANETPVASSVDLDLDLDFSLEEQNSNFRNHDMSSDAEQVTTPLDLDFGLVTSASETFATSQEATMEEVDAVEFSLDNHEISERESTGPVTDAEDFKSQAAAIFGMTAPAPLETVKPDALSAPNFGMMEFDLGSLSLDLGDRPESESDTATDVPQDPLTTKLALAKEFSAIGDDDGARALLEEVISEASGEIKTKAQNALNNL